MKRDTIGHVSAFERFGSAARSAWSLLRSFGHAKGFAAAAMLTVALGIGVNTCVFSLFDRLLFRPLPYREPDKLVQIHSGRDPVSGHYVLPTSVGLALAREPNLFSGIGSAWGGDLEPLTPEPGEDPLFWLTGVSTNTLEVLGIRPVVGAGFFQPTAPDDRAVMLTYEVWQHRYGGSNDVLSLSWVAPDAQQRAVHWRVVGVLPKQFLLPSARVTTGLFDGIYGFDPDVGNEPSLRMVGAAPFARLAPGVSLAAAQQRADALVRSQYPALRRPNAGFIGGGPVQVIPLQSGLSTTARSYVWLAVLGAWIVLAATCVTLAILLLTWNQSRRQDAGVRLSLGASPRQLVVNALGESLFLCGAGGVIGWLGYAWVRPLFVTMLPLGLQTYASDPVDVRTIAATCGIALVTAIAAGTVPAVRISRTSPLLVLRPQHAAMTLERLVGGPLLLALQAAFGVVLLVGAAATVPQVMRALWQPAGFNGSDLYMVGIPTANDRTAGDAREQVRRGREALEVARSLPGVRGASLSVQNPLWPPSSQKQFLESLSRHGFAGRVIPVDDTVFATLATRLVAGRTLSRAEIEQQALVAIINETGARRVSPGSPPEQMLGRTVTTEDGPRLIVGVAPDLRVGMDAQTPPALFVPLSATEAYSHQRDSPYPWTQYTIVLRMAPGRVPDVTLLSDRVRDLPWMLARWNGARSESVAARLGREMETPRLLALVFGTIGGITLLLTLVAIYGLASFDVRRRRDEMTVRLALGATPDTLRRHIIAVTLRPVIVGVSTGLPVSWLAVRLLSSSVSALNASDGRIYLASAGVILVAGFVAALIPSRRSLTVSVADLLRGS